MLLVADMANAQWSKWNGPYGDFITSIAYINGSKVYCTTIANDLYSSGDTGFSWQKESFSQFEHKIYKIDAGYGKLIASCNHNATPGSGFISHDSGLTFVPLPAPFADTLSVSYFGVNFKIAASGIYAYARTGFYHTTDYGQSWNALHGNIELRQTAATGLTFRCISA